MMNKNKKYLGAAIATLAVAGMVAAPQAMAKKAKKAKASTITEYHHSVTTTRSSSNGALEAQLRALQDEVSRLRAQVNASAPGCGSSAGSERGCWRTRGHRGRRGRPPSVPSVPR